MSYNITPFLISWVSIFGLLFEISLKFNQNRSKREIFLLTCVIWGTILVAITEFLSLFQFIRKGSLTIAWLFVTSVSVMAYGYCLHKRIGILALVGKRFWQNFSGFKRFAISPFGIIVLLLIIFQTITLAMIAYQYPPNNHDSMTYHLARVMHWEQNQSVAHYATNLEWQLHLNPFAEFILLHTIILNGNDNLVNFVQWFSMLTCFVGVSLIAKLLGAKIEVQIIATLLASAIPMGILQATSTQNDYVASVWLVCFVVFVLKLLDKNIRLNYWLWSSGVGLTLGLAILTKGISYFYFPPFCIVIAVVLVFRVGIRAFLFGTIMACSALALNLGHFTRNFVLYGNFTGPTDLYNNKLLTVEALASNLIRNTTIHFWQIGTESNLLNDFNFYIRQGFQLLHSFTNLAATDPRTTFADGFPPVYPDVFTMQPEPFNDSFDGNPLHVILIMIALGFLFFNQSLSTKIIGFGLSFSYLLFCLLTNWQPWASRLHLPLVVVWCSIIAVTLFSRVSEKKYLYIIPLSISLISFVWTFNNTDRSLIKPNYNYNTETAFYINQPWPPEYKFYNEVSKDIVASGCEKVGFSTPGSFTEYPLWVMLKERGFQGVIRHIEVDNPSKVLEILGFQPCAIISKSPKKDLDKTLFTEKSFNNYLYFYNNRLNSKPKSVPEGFSVPPKLGVVLDKSWLEYEPQTNSRWSQTPSTMWVWSDEGMKVTLKLMPGGMNVGGEIGSEGKLKIKLDEQVIENNLPVEAFKAIQISLNLKQGYNKLQFELEKGNFTPGSGDPRTLSIAFIQLIFDYAGN